MHQKSRWLLAAGTVLTGCASTHIYALPIQGSQAQSTFDPLIACATSRHYESQRQEDGVDIKIDEVSFVRFAVDESGQYAMGTMLNDSAVPKNERKSKFDMLKAQGDELYACATRSDPSPSASASQGSAAPMASAGAPLSACDHLDRCYSDIANSLCDPKEARCKERFRTTGQRDDATCKIALEHVAMVVKPMRIARPEWRMPTTCNEGNGTSGGTVAVSGMNWTGNWMAKVNYSYACTMPMNKPEPGNDSGSWSMTVNGSNSQLTAQVNISPSGFNLNGSGSDQSLRLCGPFPLKGKGQAAGTRDNNICIVVGQVDGPNAASGTAEGEFQTPIANCKIKEARVELTR